MRATTKKTVAKARLFRRELT
ncbi:MAG: hypothetical protein JWP15_3451, partial [Alphaproteobacteria bacterium]|nr:hypothetical protein [Alphaproteobacteria bacterium]